MTNVRLGVWDLRGNKVGRYRGVEIGDQKCRFCGIARETELHMIVKCGSQAMIQHRERMWDEIAGRCGEEKVDKMKSMRETGLMSELLGGNEIERLKESRQAGEGEGSRSSRERKQMDEHRRAIREAVQRFLVSIERDVRQRGDRSLLTDIFELQGDEAEWEDEVRESREEAWGRPGDVADLMQRLQSGNGEEEWE